MSHFIRIFIVLCYCSVTFSVFSQSFPAGDADTIRVMQYVQRAREAINQISADSSVWYARQAISISEKCGFTKGIAWGYHRLSQIYDFTGLTDSALIFGKKAERIFRETGDYYGLPYSLYTLGNIYLYKSWYEIALRHYTESHSIFSKSNNFSGITDCYAGIGLVYYFRKEWRNCIRYLMLTAEYEKQTNDDEGLPETYFNIGCAYYELGLSDSARHFYKLAETIAEKTRNNRVLTATCNNFGEIALDEKQYTIAITYFQRSIELKKQLNYFEGLGENYINMGKLYMETGNIGKAIDYVIRGIDYCNRYNAREDQADGYLVLSQLYEKSGDKASSLDAYKNYVKINDTLNNMRFAGQVAEWQTLYHLKDTEYKLETAKNQVLAQQEHIRLNKLVQTGLIALSLFIIITSFLVYRNFRNKTIIVKQDLELQDHRIRQLENERKLLATQYVLKGEETERRRLARDLHDGLGGLLSGVKLAFNKVSNSIMVTGNAVDFNHALRLLDTSIVELRRVARSLLPEALLKLGLKSSIADFCEELNKVNKTEIIFQFFGDFERVDSNLELNAFRVIQELVNNAIKHANARKLVVQMIQEPERLCFIVQDDGTGFNIHNEKPQKGIGLSTVKSRIEALNGTMEKLSTPGKGTEFVVEFPVFSDSQKQMVG